MDGGFLRLVATGEQPHPQGKNQLITCGRAHATRLGLAEGKEIGGQFHPG
jgi:hypothetical protein